MLATLNLQLSTLDLGAETPALQGIPPIDGPSEPGGFAALLQLRVADSASIEGMTVSISMKLVASARKTACHRKALKLFLEIDWFSSMIMHYSAKLVLNLNVLAIYV